MILLLSGGCAMRGQGKNVAFAADGAVAAGGVALMMSASRDSCTTDDPNVYGDHLSCEIGEGFGDGITVAAGLAMIAAGLVGALLNAAVNSGESPPAELPASALVTLPDSCAVRIAAWRTERDPVQRTLLYRDMPETCQAMLSTPPHLSGDPR
ncbi:MAG TPA: hypothetical protein VL172_22540 [Kofleriaceae bacterium]|nr:hypothetical protein [Kofleriaceae bacterium]